jgi:hypothetical protein
MASVWDKYDFGGGKATPPAATATPPSAPATPAAGKGAPAGISRYHKAADEIGLDRKWVDAFAGQETSGGTNVRDSIQGARGELQITEGRFRDAGGKDFNDDEDVARTAVRELKSMVDKFGGNPKAVAASWHSYPSNVNADGTLKRDVADKLGKRTADYATDIEKRMGNRPAAGSVWDKYDFSGGKSTEAPRPVWSSLNPEAPAEESEDGVFKQFWTGLKSGFADTNPKLAGSAAEAIGVLTDSQEWQDVGAKVKAYGERGSEGRRASVPSITDVISSPEPVSAFAKYMAYHGGAGIGTSAPSLITGGAVALATANPIFGLMLGSAGPSYIQNLGDVYESAIADEDIMAKVNSGAITKKDIARAAMLAGVPMAALDAGSFTAILGPAMAGAKKQLKQSIIKQILKGAFAEGSTEGMQEVISQFAQAYLGDNKPMMERFISVVDNIFGGIAGGGLMSAGSSVVSAQRGTGAAPAPVKGTGAAPAPVKGTGAAPASEQKLGKETVDAKPDNRPAITEKQLLASAQERLAALQKKASGTPDTEIAGPNGVIVKAQGEKKQFLTDDERAERAFLEKNINDPQALADGYGLSLQEPLVAPTINSVGRTTDRPDAPQSPPGVAPFTDPATGLPVGDGTGGIIPQPHPSASLPPAKEAPPLPNFEVYTGADTQVSTPTGETVGVQFAIADTDSLTTSFTEAGARNQGYFLPPGANRVDQINLDPERVAESPTSADGAPIVANDGQVESGNNRINGIRRAYRGPAGTDYKQWLLNNLSRFGIPESSRAAIEQMDRPVLVRLRTTPVDRNAFVMDSNVRPDDTRRGPPPPPPPGGAPQPLEFETRRRIDALGQLLPGFSTASMADVAITPFVAGTVDGITRAAPTLQQAGFDSRAVSAITDLAQALADIAMIRSQGLDVAEVLAQMEVLGEEFSDRVIDMIAGLEDAAGNPERVQSLVEGYARESMNTPDSGADAIRAEAARLREKYGRLQGATAASTPAPIEPAQGGESQAPVAGKEELPGTGKAGGQAAEEVAQQDSGQTTPDMDSPLLAKVSLITMQNAGEDRTDMTRSSGVATDEDWELMRQAGLVQVGTNEDGSTYEFVDPYYLGNERERRFAAESAERKKRMEEAERIGISDNGVRATEGRIRKFERIAEEKEQEGDLDKAAELRQKAQALRDQLNQALNERAAKASKKTGTTGPLFSRSPSSRAAVKVRDVEAAIAPFTARAKGLPKIHVLQSDSDKSIPKALRDAIAKEPEGTIAGAYHDGEVYIFADNLRDTGHASFTFLHEAGHHGLAMLLGSELDAVLLRIWQDNAAVQVAASKMVAKHGLSRVQAVNEVLADWSAEGKHPNILQKLVAAIRDIARRLGMNLKMNDADVLAIVARSRRQWQKGDTKFSHTYSAFSARAPIFYSQMAQVVSQKGSTGNPTDWKVRLNSWAKSGAYKPDELQWSGVMEWLDLQQGKVTTDQVVTFLRENGVQVEEVGLGGEEVNARAVAALKYYLIDHAGLSEFEAGILADRAARRESRAIGEIEGLIDNASDYDRLLGAFHSMPPTRYEQYQLPGGTNYREVLLTLPSKPVPDGGFRIKSPDGTFSARYPSRENAEADAAENDDGSVVVPSTKSADTYKSGHWNAPNILAHIRLNDRADNEGRRVLFVEEIQSDWAQDGRKKGFRDTSVLKREHLELRPQPGKKKDFIAVHDKRTGEVLSSYHQTEDEANAAADELVAVQQVRGGPIPAAPFVGKTDSWVALAMKRVIRMAAEGGFDAVAFVTGEQSADRYDLSKQVKSIDYQRNPSDGTFKVLVMGMDGRGAIWSKPRATLQEIEAAVGKEIAEKIERNEGQDLGFREVNYDRRLQGDGLKVGGEGMRAFYDRIVPNVAKDVLKKVGGGAMMQFEFSNDPNAELDKWEPEDGPGDGSKAPVSVTTQPGFLITDEIREKAMGGMPLFSRSGEGETRVGKVDTHVLGAERGERVESSVGRLAEEEKAIIARGAKKARDVTAADLEARARDNKRAHPTSDGWAPLTLTKVKVNESGKAELVYKTVPYDFNTNAKGKSLKTGSKDYTQRVQSMSGLMRDEVRAVYERAQQGDKAAINIIAQSGWYKEMRTRLRQEFGGLGDLFADLLGATSPNTPVRTNWDNSIEALRLATQGSFDELMPKWIDYFSRLEQAETKLRAFFDEMRKKGMTKKAIKQLDEYRQLSAEAKRARKFPDSLLPVKSNGRKFGFNGYNVARAMVDLWRVVRDQDSDIGRGATAPKAINFSGNLIGFRSRATIDVWAARMLQRLASRLGIPGMGLRIPSMAEGGVSGSALSSGENTLQFGFGQDVFTSAVRLIRGDQQMREESALAGINDDDLQALVWFIEKEIWTKNNWTSAAGEGGSFEFEADLAGVADRDRVNELRREADSSVASTAEQREQARSDIESITQKMKEYPGVAESQATLDRNAERINQRGLSKEEKEAIKAESEQARKRMRVAKLTRGYHRLSKDLDRAKAVLKKPTKEERSEMRAQAVGKLGEMARTVDRFTLGLSIQKGAEQGVEPTPPSDADMAGLARRIVRAVTSGANADTVIAVKAIATEGRYGAPERALDAEFIVNEKFDPAPLAAAVFREAQAADQDSAFVARVLRPDEKFDPLLHRPGIEIYFRDMKQAQEAARIMAGTLATRVGKSTEFGPGFFSVGGYTVIVDGRPTAKAKAGAMGTPVGMRVIYLPEFEARYGADSRLADASEDGIRDIVEERSRDLDKFASEILRRFDGVSFAGRFDYEVDARFAGEYQGAIDGYASRAPAEGAGPGRGRSWQGRPVGEGIAAAVGRLPLDGGQPGAAVLDRGDTEAGDGTVLEDIGRRGGDRGRRNQGRSLAPLEGAPTVAGATGPDPAIVAVAEQYARDQGITLRRQAAYVEVDEARAARIAAAYEAMPHSPQNPAVKEAYSNLIQQVRAQYDALVAAGYKFTFFDSKTDPYQGNPWNAMRDLRANKRMAVYGTYDGFGTEGITENAADDNLMLADTGLRWPDQSGVERAVTANDLFRAVHDAFGHGLEGAGFRERGEENAWQAHARLFTGSAVGAITSETRGQNSWLNYGPYGETNRTAKVEDTVFAENKNGLMPSWTWEEGVVGDAQGGLDNIDRISDGQSRQGMDRQIDTPRVSAIQRLRKIVRMSEKEGPDGQSWREIERLIGDLERKIQTQQDRYVRSERARGADWVRERLMRGRRQGELDATMVDMALWMIDQNPEIATDLGISISGADTYASGNYNPVSRIMRLFSQSANVETGVHEILHHTERMMSEAVQAGIEQAWSRAMWKAINVAMKKGNTELVAALQNMLLATSGDRTAHRAMIKHFDDGVLDYVQHYQLANPSEFWAVNGARIMGKRYEAQGQWVAQAKQWLREFIEKAKGLLGLPSDAAVLRGLREVMNGNGVRLSRQMLSERVTGRRGGEYNALSLTGIAKALKPGPIKGMSARVIDRIDRALTPLGSLPSVDAYLAERGLALGKVADADRIGHRLYKAFAGQKAKVQTEVYNYLTTQGASPSTISDPKARQEAVDAKLMIEHVGDELEAHGLLDAATNAANRGGYLPRVYLKYLLSDDGWKAVGTGRKPSTLGYLIKRENIPQAVRDVILGEIKDPGYLANLAFTRSMRDMALLDWLDGISQKDEWVYRKDIVQWQGQRVTAFWLANEADRIRKQIPYYTGTTARQATAVVAQMDAIVNPVLAALKKVPSEYRQMPNSPRYGRLRGMFVRNEIYDDIIGVGARVGDDAGWAERALGYGGYLTKATQMWKTAKVALNPPAQIRNFLSNGILLQLSGVPLLMVPVRMAQAISEIRLGKEIEESKRQPTPAEAKKIRHWTVAKKYGITVSTFSSQELFRAERELVDLKARMRGAGSFAHLLNIGAKIAETAGDIYQFSEALYKTAKIIDEMEKGASEDRAAAEAQKWLFDYSLVSPSIRYLRNAPIGAPFLTFSAKVAPRLLEVAMHKPWRFAPWVALAFGMPMVIAAMGGPDEEDQEKIKKLLPESWQDKGHVYVLPVKDPVGRWQVLDLSPLMPWSMFTSAAKQLARGDVQQAAQTMGLIGGPASDAIIAWKTNTDPFSGRQIAQKGDPVALQMGAILTYIYNMAAPPVLTNRGFVGPDLGDPMNSIGGKLPSALRGSTNKFGDPVSTVPQAAAGAVGFLVRSVDPVMDRGKALVNKRREIDDAKIRLKQILQDRALSPEQREKALTIYRKEIMDRSQKVREFAEETQ